jgi:hypothetical protein
MSAPSGRFLGPPLRIKTNNLLAGAGPTVSLDEALALVRGIGIVPASVAAGVGNLSSISEDQLERVHSLYGDGGLFRLIYLATSHERPEFEHFWHFITFGSLGPFARLQPAVDIELDNDVLHHGDSLASFNWNVLQPSLSRKLYNPGRHPGYLVYGIGGPKILVSHPFIGASGEVYGAFENASDVVSTLMLDGYYDGSFLLLDNLIGLNYDVRGVPAWLWWFAIIAMHSDLVLFVRETGSEFSDAQRKEIDFTPNHVQTKIVEIGKLQWAAQEAGQSYQEAEVIYVGPEGRLTRDEVRTIEREHAAPLIESYTEGGFPRDRFLRLGEEGHLTEFPLSYPIYG